MKLHSSIVDTNALPVNNMGKTDFVLLDAKKFTIPQAAKKVGVGETKMRLLILKNELPVLKIGGKVLVLERDLENFLWQSYGPIVIAKAIASERVGLPEAVRNSEFLKKK